MYWVARSERSDGRDDLTIHAHRYALSVLPTDNLRYPFSNAFSTASAIHSASALFPIESATSK